MAPLTDGEPPPPTKLASTRLEPRQVVPPGALVSDDACLDKLAPSPRRQNAALSLERLDDQWLRKDLRAKTMSSSRA